MKNIIAIFGTLALMTGMGSSNASAENFFKKLGREVRNAHERHEEMFEDLHESRPRVEVHVREENRGHYESREIQSWVEGYYTTQYVDVRTAGRYECREVVEIVTPASCQRIYIQPVYRIEVDHCGRQVRVMVRCGYWTERQIPAVTCTKTIRVWVEGECRRVAKQVWIGGHYETKCVRVWVCD